MFKRKALFSILVALVVSGFPAAVLGATLHGGANGALNPANAMPASADLYVELNRGGSQGSALQQLASAFTSRPATAAAIARLERQIGPAALGTLNTLLTAFTDRVAVGVFARAGLTGTPGVAVVAQLRPSSYLNGGNPLAGLATFSPYTTYRGTSVYRVTFTGGGGSVYGAIVAGDGVLAPDLTTLDMVVDSATFHAPSLATNGDFVTTTGQLQPERALTLYVSRHLVDLIGSGRDEPRDAPRAAGELPGPALRAGAGRATRWPLRGHLGPARAHADLHYPQRRGRRGGQQSRSLCLPG